MIAVDHDVTDLESARSLHHVPSAIHDPQRQQGRDPDLERACKETMPTLAPARRLDVSPTEAAIRGKRDWTHGRSPSSDGEADALNRRRSGSGTVPIDPAPSVMTTSPGRAIPARACGRSASFGTTSTGHPEPPSTEAAS